MGVHWKIRFFGGRRVVYKKAKYRGELPKTADLENL